MSPEDAQAVAGLITAASARLGADVGAAVRNVVAAAVGEHLARLRVEVPISHTMEVGAGAIAAHIHPVDLAPVGEALARLSEGISALRLSPSIVVDTGPVSDAIARLSDDGRSAAAAEALASRVESMASAVSALAGSIDAMRAEQVAHTEAIVRAILAPRTSSVTVNRANGEVSGMRVEHVAGRA